MLIINIESKMEPTPKIKKLAIWKINARVRIINEVIKQKNDIAKNIFKGL